MKEIDELNLPDNLRFAQDHEWVRPGGETVPIGISDYAQDQLGDIVFVEMPAVGDIFEKGAEFGTVESVKAVSELYIPISGEVTATNSALEDAPELLNEDPYEKGWIIEVRPTAPAQIEELMDKDAYLQMLRG
jgi:glycine cleavage system H protein